MLRDNHHPASCYPSNPPHLLPVLQVKRDDIDNVLAEMPSLRRLVVGSATMTAVVAQYIQKAMPHLQVKRS